MEALIASYGDASSDSDSDSPPEPPRLTSAQDSAPLPPPPLSLLSSPNSVAILDYSESGQSSRVRTFPHVEGNYALHVYIPVCIPSTSKQELARFLKRVAHLVPGLHVVDVDVPLDFLCKNDEKLEQVALGREFHISLGRTVPIRVHQIDSLVTMLRQKLQLHKRSDNAHSIVFIVKTDAIKELLVNHYTLWLRCWIDFSKWEVFVNDDCTRTFLSVEVTAAGLAEITKQIQAVNEVYKLHNLPEFYKNPRPHISLAWALGDVSNSLKNVVHEERAFPVGGSYQKRIFSVKFSGINCRIGNKTYKICKLPDT